MKTAKRCIKYVSEMCIVAITLTSNELPTFKHMASLETMVGGGNGDRQKATTYISSLFSCTGSCIHTHGT